MDLIIVTLIVAAAVGFTVKSFLKIYKGEGGCSCDAGGSCSAKASCSRDFPIAEKK